jgi:primosomal protein N'
MNICKKIQTDNVMEPKTEKTHNTEKRKPKGPIHFNLSLNEEQRLAKSEILTNTVTLLKGQAGSGKTLLACQIALDMFFNREIEKIRRAIELLNNVKGNSHIEMAEKELGKLFLSDWNFEEVPDSNGSMRLIDNETPEQKKHNSKVFARSNEIEEEEWNELWKIIKGQDHKNYKKHLNKSKISGNDTNAWSEWFDGSGIRGWWD